MGRRKRDDAAFVALFAIAVFLIVGVFKVLAAIVRGLSAAASPKERQDAKVLLIATSVVGAAVVAIVLTRSDGGAGSTTYAATSSMAESATQDATPPGASELSDATRCVDTRDWDCALAQLQAADRMGASTSSLRFRAAVTALSIGQQQLEAANTAKRSARAEARAEAITTLSIVETLEPDGASARTARQLVGEIGAKVPSAKRHAHAAAPTQEPAPSYERSQPASPARSCCKVCTTGMACGNSCISRSKTCHQGAGCACDGE